MSGMAVDAAFRRRNFIWPIILDGHRCAVELRIGSGEADVLLDGASVCGDYLPTPQRRWLLLVVPGMKAHVAVAVVRFPGNRFRAAVFVDSVNVDDGSGLADWGADSFPAMDRFESGAADSVVAQPQTALLFALAFGFSYLSRRTITPGTVAIATAVAACSASWVLFSGRVVIPYLASQRSWSPSVRYLTWATIFVGGLAVIIVAGLSLG
jgi:hypothetical protein